MVISALIFPHLHLQGQFYCGAQAWCKATLQSVAAAEGQEGLSFPPTCIDG